ncbi:hypothetical protein BS47DRAFT_1382648 [Hydnum rufescens UP504]|uniref:Uncharacterized protein n=1 Tax=Hydnum rufescens UP504 TaxID=1448309 RepID=A0A9P6AW48_9AGAM|nr:hypothetical protein BS47DRAFT_1382648 [Hydnum rufescens UP504]
MFLLIKNLRQELVSRRCLHTFVPLSSGHNRWSKISHHKGAEDVRKSKIYARAAHEIETAAKSGGSADPTLNLSLAVALRRARANGVPKDNIASALARAADPIRQSSTQSVVYEALGPGQAALIIECESDNVNRTYKNIREVLLKHDARFAPVRFMFSRVGRITLTPREGADPQHVWDAAIDAGAEDVNSNPEESTREMEVITTPSTLNVVSNVLSSPPHAHNILSMELAYVPLSEGQDGTGMDKNTGESEEESHCRSRSSWRLWKTCRIVYFPNCLILENEALE